MIQNKLTVDPTVFDVVFVGGGPVGLWTAIQAKLQNPRLNIVVLEQYAEYQRIHNLFLEAQSMATDCHAPELKELINHLKQHRTLSTQVLESSLSELAQKVGVVMQKSIKIENPAKDLACFTNAKVIVGADGAHSIMRQAVVGKPAEECYEMQEDLHYIADLTYSEVREPVGLLKKMTYNSAVGNAIYEIHSNRNQRTTLRTFITPEAYQRMKGATRKTPEALNGKGIDAQVRKEFQTFLDAKYEGDAASYVNLAEATVTTTLGTYISKNMVRQEGNRTYCLVGDAAFGVPFFRSLNNGFLSGTKLAKAISAHFNPEIDEMQSKVMSSFAKRPPFKAYEKGIQGFARRQVWVANAKSFGVNAWIKIAKMFNFTSPSNLLSSAPSSAYLKD